MNEHFIKEIEIKNFKCFEDFKADGFGRVNLIGGKNNVGKTTLLEALYINTNAENSLWFLNSIFQISKNRDNFFVANNIENLTGLYKLIFAHNSNLSKNYTDINCINTDIYRSNFNFKEKFTGTKVEYSIDDKSYSENISLNDIKDTLLLKDEFNTNDKSHILRPIGLSNYNINKYYSNIQRLREENLLNNYLTIFDNDIEEFKILNKEPKVYSNRFEDFISITQLGDGSKKLINTFVLLYSSKDGYLFIDEIDNGIHFSMLDELWTIILEISQKLNVQVFATTHSKECIESYARVAKRLEEDDISMITLARNPKGELKALELNASMFYSELEQNHEVRGW